MSCSYLLLCVPLKQVLSEQIHILFHYRVFSLNVRKKQLLVVAESNVQSHSVQTLDHVMDKVSGERVLVAGCTGGKLTVLSSSGCRSAPQTRGESSASREAMESGERQPCASATGPDVGSDEGPVDCSRTSVRSTEVDCGVLQLTTLLSFPDQRSAITSQAVRATEGAELLAMILLFFFHFASFYTLRRSVCFCRRKSKLKCLVMNLFLV